MGSGAVYNDPALTKKFVATAANMIGNDNILIAKFPNNGSENFYRFSKEVPSVFFRIGVNNNLLERIEPAHSPKFTAADEALKTGVSVMTAVAIAFLQNVRTPV